MGQTFKKMGWEDREVKVRRGELLEVLRKSRAQHIQEYLEACAGYRDAALKRIDDIFSDLRAKINGLKEGQTIAIIGLQFGLAVPVSHEKAYDQIIRMMEMSVDEEIELTAGQFACFVMDDWDWKEQWSTSNMAYRLK
jgi:hypothetical protein